MDSSDELQEIFNNIDSINCRLSNIENKIGLSNKKMEKTCQLSILKYNNNPDTYYLTIGSETMITNRNERIKDTCKILDNIVIKIPDNVSYLRLMHEINKLLTYKVLMYKLSNNIIVTQEIKLYNYTEKELLEYIHFIFDENIIDLDIDV